MTLIDVQKRRIVSKFAFMFVCSYDRIIMINLKRFTLVKLPGEIGCEAVGVVEGLVPGGGSPLEETLSYADTMYGKLVICIIQRIHPVGSGANENLRQSISLFGG